MRELLLRRLRLFICVAVVVFTTGCATIGALDDRDPLEGFNRGVYSFNQGMDKVIFDPLSKLYQAITPPTVFHPAMSVRSALVLMMLFSWKPLVAMLISRTGPGSVPRNPLRTPRLAETRMTSERCWGSQGISLSIKSAEVLTGGSQLRLRRDCF